MSQLFSAFVTILCVFITISSTGQTGTMSYDGVDDNINIGTTALDNVRTIELWFKPGITIDASLPERQTLLQREFGPTNIQEAELYFMPTGFAEAGKIRFAYLETVSNVHVVYSNSNTWNTGQWYHVAAVIHPVQGLTLFIDGIKQVDVDGSWTAPYPATNDATLLGSWGGGIGRYFEGEMEDVRLSTTARYDVDFAPPCPTLTTDANTSALYNFNAGSGSLAFDATGANDGVINGASWSSDFICSTSGNTVYFDGVDDYITLNSGMLNNARTVELWFKPAANIDSNLPERQTLVQREFGPTNIDEFELYFMPTGFAEAGKIRFALLESVSNVHVVYSNSNTWNAGQWYHVAAVVDPVQGLTLFIDGVKQTDIDGSWTSPVTATNDEVRFGSWGGGVGRFYNGQIEDVRVSASARYSVDFTPPCPDLISDANTLALYNFNTGTGLTAFDAASTFDGTLENGVVWMYDSICTNGCAAPVADFSYDSANGLSVDFTDLSSSSSSWWWDFGDGNQSALQNPTHVYSTGGSYTVCLIATDSCGSDTFCTDVCVTNLLADFTSMSTGLTASFTDASQGATAWTWDFGDGNFSSLQNPDHTFSTIGTYYVCLTVSDDCSSDTICDSVFVTNVGVNALSDQPQFSVYPNPAQDLVVIEINAHQNNAVIEIYDAVGKLVTMSRLQGNRSIQDVSAISGGVYYVIVRAEGQPLGVQKLIVR